MPTLKDIEAKTKLYAEQREKLAQMVDALNEGIQALKKDQLPAIKRALARAAQHQAELQALISASADLFVKPRTVIFHGVKVGFTKGKGGIEITDADRTILLIRKHLPEQAEALITVRESPFKPGLQQLTVADLKRVGCVVVETGDQVVIKAVDSEVDKMVDVLLKGAVDEEVAA